MYFVGVTTNVLEGQRGPSFGSQWAKGKNQRLSLSLGSRTGRSLAGLTGPSASRSYQTQTRVTRGTGSPLWLRWGG